jgi:CheY-like chemotaxis protein
MNELDKSAKFTFAKKDTVSSPIDNEKWKILIVDDEKEVHNISTMILKTIVFAHKGIELLHAYSAQEAKAVLAENQDIALIFLDVVMETEDAGLKLVQHIRYNLKNKLVQIILRTGQPGQAPLKNVIVTYQINDYKEKTEFTANKMFASVVTSLRAYQAHLELNRNRQDIENVLTATNKILSIHQRAIFVPTVMDLIDGVIGKPLNMLYMKSNAPDENLAAITVVSGRGLYSTYKGKALPSIHSKNVLDGYQRLSLTQKSGVDDYAYWGYFRNEEYLQLLFIEGEKKFSNVEKNLLQILTQIIDMKFDNFSD